MRPRVIRGVVVMLALVTLAVASARASELSDDLAARRARVMNALGPDTMLVVWSAPPHDRAATRFFTALDAGRGRVAIPLDRRRGLDDPLTPQLEFARRIRDRFVGFEIADASVVLDNLRVVKTAYERKVLVKSLEISSDAQMAG